MERSGANLRSGMQSATQKGQGPLGAPIRTQLDGNMMSPPVYGTATLSHNLMQYKHDTPQRPQKHPVPKTQRMVHVNYRH